MKEDYYTTNFYDFLKILEKKKNSTKIETLSDEDFFSSIETFEDFIKKWASQITSNREIEIKKIIENEAKNCIYDGLKNESDKIDLYIKYTEQIDSILDEIDFFDFSPSELGFRSIYDYLLEGVEKAIVYQLKKLI